MTRMLFLLSAGLLLNTGLLLSACGGGGGGSSAGSDERGADTDNTPRSISIAFSAVAEGEPIRCGHTYSLGTADTAVSLLDFRFYVHNLRLATSTGAEVPVTLTQNVWQNGDVALLDFQDRASDCDGEIKDTHAIITGTIPDNAGTLTGVRFTVGVPENRNHILSSSAPSPLNIFNLFWGWQAGYKFMRMDMKPASGPLTTWNIHLGSTGCTGAPQSGETVTCSNNNRTEISLDGFDPATNRVQIDYAALVTSENLDEDSGGMPGCMSATTDPECNSIFTALGLNLASGDTDPALEQTAFSVAP